MRSETLYLTDIVEAADAIARFVDGLQREEFLDDELRQSAVLQKLTVIGEAASRLAQEFRRQHPDVEWRKAAALRNIAVHEYFSVSWDIIWATATVNIPQLRSQAAAALAHLADEE
jgi:uncharacterized protein with HEPN domain